MTKGSRPEQAVLTKVRPLTQFQCLHFKRKIINLLGGQINLPLIREDFSFVPCSNSVISVSDPPRAFLANTMPFKGPPSTLPRALGTRRRSGVSCYPQRPSDSVQNNWHTLEMCISKRHTFLKLILDCKQLTEWNWVGDPSWTKDTDMSKTAETRAVIEGMVDGLNDHRYR